MQLKDKIYTIRNKQVMLDKDLAELYEVETKRLNEQVRRNIKRFPEDFCFQLTEKEYSLLRSQIATIEIGKGKHSKYLPFVFTQEGVASLSGVLNSDVAIEINIKIMRAFVEMRHFLSKNVNIFNKFQQIDQKLLTHDSKLNQIFQAIDSKQLLPNQGIFFEGQLFDAFSFIIKLIKQANKEIILIDNYINEETLTLLSNKNDNVQITIYTKNITKQLLQAKNKFNEQYKHLEIIQFKKSHDRFLIIDNRTYHIGASLKDAGKKWFAFTKLNEKLKLFDKLT